MWRLISYIFHFHKSKKIQQTLQFTLKNPHIWDIEKMKINVSGLKNNMVVLQFQADGITQDSQPIEIHE